MVSTWQAIVIALAGSVLGALSGAFTAYLTLRATQMSMVHERREAWRNRLIEAAAEFAASYTPAFHRLNTVILSSDEEIRTRSLKAAIDAHEEAERLSTRVGILFGSGSAADNAAQDLLEALARGTMLAHEREDEQARKEWHQANKTHTRFVEAVYLEISPK